MKRLSYSITSGGSASAPSSPVFCLPHNRDPYSSCCFLFCQVHLRTAAIIIGIIDVVGQFGQIYRHAELFFLLFQCNFFAASIVTFILTAIFVADMIVIVLLFAGIATDKVQFVIPMLFRYTLSIIFDFLLILYASASFLFTDGSLKQPMIWLYRLFHECPKDEFWIVETNSTAINGTFDEAGLSKALDLTLFGILCISLIQMIFQVWFVTTLKHYCEYLIYQSDESRRRSAEPLVA